MRIVLLVLLASLLYAQSLRERRGAYSLIDHLKGEFRSGYMNYTKEETAVAGHFHFMTKAYEGLCLGATLEGVGSSNRGEFGGENRNFAMVSELFFQYRTKSSFTKIGRIMVEWTPHADADDIRMIPNYFEGFYTQVEINQKTLHFLYLTKMAGWESGGKYNTFKSLNEVLGVKDKIEGFAGIGFEGAGWSVWGYYLDRSAWILYASYELVEKGWTLGLQFDRAQSVDSKLLGSIDAITIGFYVQRDFELFNIYGAMNGEYGDGAMISFGGGPFFTSMEILTLDMFGKNARSYTLGVEKEIYKANFGLMCGWFRGNRFQREIDIYATRRLSNGFNFDIIYANVQRGKNLFRAIVKYSF